MLEVSNVQVAYGAAPALWGVTFELRGRELLCVVGPNGAGKTTLINTLAGVLRAKAGRIVFEGADVTGAPPEQMAERELCFDGVLVDFGNLQKNFYRLVLLLVEQQIQALELGLR